MYILFFCIALHTPTGVSFQKFKNFKEIRKRKADEVDLMAREMLNSKRPTRSEDEPQGMPNAVFE